MLLSTRAALLFSVGHDNAGGPGGAWFLERVEIELPLLHRRWNFPHSRWISRDDDDRTLEHALYPDSVNGAAAAAAVTRQQVRATSRQSGAQTDRATRRA